MIKNWKLKINRNKDQRDWVNKIIKKLNRCKNQVERREYLQIYLVKECDTNQLFKKEVREVINKKGIQRLRLTNNSKSRSFLQHVFIDIQIRQMLQRKESKHRNHCFQSLLKSETLRKILMQMKIVEIKING